MNLEIAILLLLLIANGFAIALITSVQREMVKLETLLLSLKGHRDEEVHHLRDQVSKLQESMLALADGAAQVRLARQRGEIPPPDPKPLPTRPGRNPLRMTFDPEKAG